MNSILNWPQLDKRKATLIALSIGLALGFGCGQMLHSEAQSTPKVETSKSESGSSVPVHTGINSEPRTKFRTSTYHMFPRASMFSPWWSIMQFDPELSWMFRNFDMLSSDWDSNLVSMPGVFIPRFDATDQHDTITITAEVPGLEEKDLDVTVNDDSVTIKGAKKDEMKESKTEQSAHSIERSFGEFERTISLPCKVESQKAQATLKNGILTLVIPKNQTAQCEGKKVAIRRE